MTGEITLRALRYFMAAVHEGTITEAAKAANVVPSAVHTAINQVEAAFGLQLITRSRATGVSLTATGREMAGKIQGLLDEYETLMQAGGDMRTRLTGTLRIGYYAPAAPAFLPRIFKQVLDENDEVAARFFECDNQSAQDGLLSGAFDIIVCVANAMKPGITYETLLEVPGYVLAPASHPFATRPSITMRDLSEEKIVLLDLPIISEYYSAQFDLADITPNIVATATSLEMVRSLVGQGVGCSLLHMVPASEFTYAGDEVRAVPLSPAIEPFRIVLGQLQGNPRRLVKAFAEEIRTYFQKIDAQELRISSSF